MPTERYEQHRRRAADREADQSRSGRDVGPLPEIADKRRRGRCKNHLLRYLETYHAPAFPLPWSDDHLTAIADIERKLLSGDCKALAMPRGSGKTTILERAILWTTLYRHHLYALLIGANDEKASENLESIKIELACNDLLYADFPEVCHCLRALDWIPQRAGGQLLDGEHTLVEWGKKIVVFPTVAGEPGAIIKSGGILTAVRGAKHTCRDGRIVRPSAALLDDPQTRQSAESLLQCDRREDIITQDVLGMAGPGESLAALAAVTVIKHGDVSDRLLNRELHPDWHGQRTKMLVSFPERIDLWQTYYDLRVQELQEGGDGSQSNKYYADNQRVMDRGGAVSWQERFIAGKEISAIQHAMNLWFRNQATFFSEYQNAPIDASQDEADVLSAVEIAQRSLAFKRNIVPPDATLITAYCDVQDKLVYYMVCAWHEDFTGYVIDYGTWPDQRRQYFTLSSAKETLARKFKGLSKEARLRRALHRLLDEPEDGVGLLVREWKRDGDGAAMLCQRAAVDAGYKAEDVVHPFIRQSPHRARLIASHGRGVTARQKPFSEWAKKRGDRVGLHWRIPKAAGKRSARHLLIDTNFWKSFVHARLAMPAGERGALTLFAGSAKSHRMLADHLTAERKERIEGRGRIVDEWNQIPGQDNHLFDCLVGCAVLAAMEGCQLRVTETGEPTEKKRRRPRERTATPLL